MQYQITNVGLAAAFAAANNGPQIRIGQFKVGSANGYAPLVTDTGLHGAELYAGAPTNYDVLDANTAEFTLRMGEDVGTWQFGEIGLYLVTGELFALGTLEHPQWKVAYPSTDFNRVNLRVRLILNGAIPRVELVVQNVYAGVINELPSVDDLPRIQDALTNAYLCHSQDTNGNDALATKGANWTIHSHMRRRFSGAVVSATSTSLTTTGLGINDATPGRYLVQVTSGPNTGLVRRLASLSGNTVTWVRPLLGLTAGHQIEVLESNSSDGSGSDDAFFYSCVGR